MKKFLLSLSLLGLVGLTSAQTVIFEDDFEAYTDFAIENVGEWTLIDVDGLNTYGFTGVQFENSGVAKSFQVFNSTATEAPLEPSETSDWTGHSGLKGMVCFASVPNAGQVNNDWLISPQIELAESDNQISFWYKACASDYSQEEFTVSISTTGTETSDFTIISDNPVSIDSGDITWHEFVYTIPESYNGQNIYVGINCISNDQFGFMVDDFKVITTGSMSVNDVALANITSVYPNPAKDMVNIKLSEDFDAARTTVTLTSVTGKKAAQFANVNEVNVSNLAAGVYVMTIKDGKKTETKKLIKK